jgi:predicted O-methyltransferase YrrM
MQYKKYYRKTSLKQKGVGDFFLNEVKTKSPRAFLEVGVFHGVTARNICELLNNLHGNDFKYIGLDLFEENDENKNEVIPNTTFSSNPVKQFYYKYIKRQNPYSLEAVKELLKKFNDNIHLIKGNSNKVLNKIDMSKIDYVFLDGGHEYNTVLNDLNCCFDVINNNGTVLCDDYDLKQAPGVKKAIDEFVKEKNFNCSIICNGRFAKIEKN